MGFLPVICVLAWLSGPRASAASSRTRPLPSFTTVQVSLPFNVKISPANGFSFKLDASEQVDSALDCTVSNSVLYLGTRGDFKTQQPISATVFLPAGSLQKVLVQSPVNLVAVDSGFSVQTFTADVAGTSTLYVRNLVANKVSVTSSGTSSTFLSGKLGDVFLKGSGVSKYYLQGQANSLGLDLSGVSTAESAISSDNLKITGNVAFPGRVSYVRGTCSLAGEGNGNGDDDDEDQDDESFYGGGGGGGYAGALPGGAFGRRRNLFQYGGLSDILGSSCKKVSSVDIPKPDLSFTCGIDVKVSSKGGSNGSNGNAASGGNGGAGGSNNGNVATPGTGNTGQNSGQAGIVIGSNGRDGSDGSATSGDTNARQRAPGGRRLRQSGADGADGTDNNSNGGGNGQDGGDGGNGGNGGNNNGRDASGTSGNTGNGAGNGGVAIANNGNGGNGGNGNNGANGSNGNAGNRAGNGGTRGNGLTIQPIACQSSAARNMF